MISKKKTKKKKTKVFAKIQSDLEKIFGRNPKFKGFFSPKLGDLRRKKKKKGLRQNSEWFFGRNPKFKGFFRPKFFTKLEAAISSNFANSDVWGGAVFEWGGLFSIFHIKSASKAQKACDFAHFTSQWVGLEPPPAPPCLRYCDKVRYLS